MHRRAAVATIQAEPQGLSAGFGVCAPMQDAPAHGDFELNFVYGGRLRYFMGGRFAEVGAGSLSVFWGALPYRIVEVEAKTEFMRNASAAKLRELR
jgi:hypothetical protein